MNRLLREQRGITLVETLVAVSILALVVTSVTGLLVAAQQDAVRASAWQDETQQLRLAMRQMMSDFTYARWDSDPMPAGEVRAMIYTPYTVLGTEDGDWPGDLDPTPEFTVKYTLVNGVLVREILDGGFGQTYTRQVLATGLASGSVLSADDSSRMIQVTLRKQMPGVSKVAEVSSAFYVR